jgi:hypothetical protein
MSSTLPLEMARLETEARLQALSGRHRPESAAVARELVSHTLSATEHLRHTWEYPRRALGEAGMEAGAFCEVCRSVLRILDMHLALLGLIRQVAEDASARAGAGGACAARAGAGNYASARAGAEVDGVAGLDGAEAQVRAARRGVEDLLAFVGRPRKPIDWQEVRKAEEAFGRGEYTRLNPDAKAPAARGDE